MKTMDISWPEFKQIQKTKSLAIQYIETPSHYDICVGDHGLFIWRTVLAKEIDITDCEDFEKNYKVEANKPIGVEGKVV